MLQEKEMNLQIKIWKLIMNDILHEWCTYGNIRFILRRSRRFSLNALVYFDWRFFYTLEIWENM